MIHILEQYLIVLKLNFNNVVNILDIRIEDL